MDGHQEVPYHRPHHTVRSNALFVSGLSYIHPFCSFLIASHYTSYDWVHLAINGAVLAVLLIAKLPEMHRVRLFHVNEKQVD